ncbi:MAG TPA: hypothetical protein GX702_06965 [Chloroflexi bacterium]|jgi:hypothetical protein|nr:hypothetical protein [Chloroflexota bacterium]
MTPYRRIRRGIHPIVLAIVGVLMLAVVAISVVKREREMVARPDDLAIVYHWSAGALPPPYHFKYEVLVGPHLRGEIVLSPEGGGYQPPTWRQSFAVDEDDLAALYTLMRRVGVFSKQWFENFPMAVGGQAEWLEVTAYGRHYVVPPSIRDSGAMTDVYDAVRALVPADLWDELAARREQFERDYESDR